MLKTLALRVTNANFYSSCMKMTQVINTAPKVILYGKIVTKVIIPTEHDKSDKFFFYVTKVIIT